MNYLVTILMLAITTLLGVVTYFLKKHFDKVDSISKDVNDINQTLTSFKIEFVKHDERLKVVERQWTQEVFGKVK